VDPEVIGLDPLAWICVACVLLLHPVPWRILGPGAPPAIAVVAAVPALAPAPVALTPAEVAAAVGTGVVLGLWSAVPAWVLLGAAHTTSAALGLHRVRSAALTLAWILVTSSIALGLGLHRVALASLGAVSDIGAAAGHLPTADELVVALHGAVVLGLALTTPVLLSGAVAEVGVRALGAAVPGGGSAAAVAVGVATWARLAAGLVALAAAFSTHPEAWVRGLRPP
jgi:hypothetical protein